VLRRATSARRSTGSMTLLLGGALLFGCPQLLEDSFATAPALPATGLDSGGGLPDIGSDAGAEGPGSGGASGAGGGALNVAGNTSSVGGTGGSSELPDASTAGAAGADPDAGEPPPPATELGGLLAHRYRFEGAGSTAVDEVGTGHGTLTGTTLTAGSGKVTLSGNDQYVDLPNGLISSLESVTLEAWVNWLADPTPVAAEWQNVFDFGNTAAEGSQGTAITHLYVTAKSSVSGRLRAGYTLTGYDDEIFLDGSRVLPAASDPANGTQVVLVVNGVQGSLAVYVDGVLEGSTASGQAINLAALVDNNAWLGRSQYTADPEFQGEILDFRIYATALSAAQVALSHSLGADGDL
jgi:hypothetical protein